MNEIPTPETDSHLDLYAFPEKEVHQNWADFARDLERRLTVARDGFKELINAIETGSFSSGEYSRCEIKQAKETLTKTAPKP